MQSSVAELRDLAYAACRACGARAEMAEVLVEASLAADWAGRGEMGLSHLPDYLDGLHQGRIDGQAMPRVERPAAAERRRSGALGKPSGRNACPEGRAGRRVTPADLVTRS